MKTETITISAFDAASIRGIANSLQGNIAMEEYGLFLSDTSNKELQGRASDALIQFFANAQFLVRELNTILQSEGQEE